MLKFYRMIEELLKDVKPTDIPLVYLNKEPKVTLGRPWIVFVFGPSGVGKDTLAKPLVEKDILHTVKTATSRIRRIEQGEPEDAYVWMRQRRDDETENEYYQNLIKEYDLIEYDAHMNVLYGTPKASLRSENSLFIIDTHGVETISKQMEGSTNLLGIFILPEDIPTMERRIMRERREAKIRLEKAYEELSDAPHLANFYLHNREGQIPQAQQSLEKLVRKFIK